MGSILQTLQQQLEALHGVDVQLDVDAYTVDATIRAEIPGAIDGLVEQFFVRDDGESLELALFIAPHMLAQLQADYPLMCLRLDNLENFCVAVEGVSHFVFLVWRAGLGRPVTALELELQAEVDKFVCGWLLILQGKATPELTVDVLFERLFARCVMRQDVPHSQHERYQTAHEVARRFCRGLIMQQRHKPHLSTLIAAARDFFRRGLPEKLTLAA